MSQEIRSCLIHSCSIERADVAIDTLSVQDRRIAKYDTPYTGVACWFEHVGTAYEFNEQIGQVPIPTYNVHFMKGTDVRNGDRLLRTDNGLRYLVQSVQDNSAQGFHIIAIAVEKKFATGQ